MRKISFIMAALALVLGVTQCKKENKPLASGETQRIVLTASNGNDGSKVAVTQTPTMLNLTWESTDVIMASGAVEGTLAYKSDVEPGTATFEGSVTKKEGNKVTFSYGQKGVLSTVFSEQTGDVAWIQGHLYLESDEVDYQDDGVYGEEDQEVEMELQYAVLKLDLSALGTEAGTTVTISNASGPVATVAGVKTDTKVYYVAMPAAESTTYTFSGNDKSVEKTWTLENNIFYTMNNSGDAILVEPATPAPTIPEGALSGLFSVSADKQVYFSQGNLQATYNSSTSAYTFGFASNQYSYVGNAAGNTTIDSQTDGAVVDLFGWSTDGESNNWGIHTKNSSTGGFTTGSFKDWGNAYCESNSITPGTWRTLTQAEWSYLLAYDLAEEDDDESSPRYGLVNKGVTVCGKANCVVLLPDDWKWGETVGSGWQEGGYSEETEVKWSTMEAAGAVCLPKAGKRVGNTSQYVGSEGFYWSSLNLGDNYAYAQHFYSNSSEQNNSYARYDGFSVRLVSEK